jgi:hypothetical protein
MFDGLDAHEKDRPELLTKPKLLNRAVEIVLEGGRNFGWHVLLKLVSGLFRGCDSENFHKCSPFVIFIQATTNWMFFGAP